MNKTIIAIYGRAGEGKSETIKLICQNIIRIFPNAIPSEINIDYSGDILLTITIGNIKIGIESQGDPNSRMISDDTIKKLADATFDKDLGNCDIIICATRTEGMTVNKVDQIANDYNFHVLYLSSFWSPSLNHQVLNQIAAENAIEIITALMIGRL
jgi:hypothetical protein